MKTIIALTSVMIALFIFVIYALYVLEKEWEQFAIDNECVLIEKKDSKLHLITGGSNSGSFIVEPGEKSYKCNDGMIYTR